jgi:crossover junction endodeoxyribonuclease RuvC
VGAAQVAPGQDPASSIRPAAAPAATASAIPVPLCVLGVDPGLNCTGYGVLEVRPGAIGLREAGVIRTLASADLAARLAEIHQGIGEVLAAFRPAALALEQIYSHYQHPRTSVLMAHARGVICLAAAQAGIPLAHYAATQVKKTLTGSGRAGKPQMQRAVCRELGLTAPPEPPDVADALALALCHVYLEPAWLAVMRTGATPSARGRVVMHPEGSPSS